ncbi:hypothetical protein ACOACO_12545 [Nocardioides sp. CPCC 205120]|uniref:hypothetical protein n=1 Tax=Nocardioides sp. CPCC 205120 TaxID=3406462 RepID=UPI003B504E8C
MHASPRTLVVLCVLWVVMIPVALLLDAPWTAALAVWMLLVSGVSAWRRRPDTTGHRAEAD